MQLSPTKSSITARNFGLWTRSRISPWTAFATYSYRLYRLRLSTYVFVFVLFWRSAFWKYCSPASLVSPQKTILAELSYKENPIYAMGRTSPDAAAQAGNDSADRHRTYTYTVRLTHYQYSVWVQGFSRSSSLVFWCFLAILVRFDPINQRERYRKITNPRMISLLMFDLTIYDDFHIYIRFVSALCVDPGHRLNSWPNV